MYRIAEADLQSWYSRSKRKPLILRGARQVGKTELVRQFCRNNQISLIEINCERYLYLDALFKELDINRIVKELFAISGSRESGKDELLFLDEIQATPYAIMMLRYLYEERPELPVIAAGSLLEFSLKDHNYSMPVGRVEYYYLGPLSFNEYLYNIYPDLFSFVTQFHKDTEIPDIIHSRLCQVQREYLFVGGMPEAVLTRKETEGVQGIGEVHASIVETYIDDFSKYAKQKDLVLLQQVFRKIPSQIGKKIKYVHYSRDHRAGEVKEILNLLEKARIITKVIHSHCNGIPLEAELDDKTYKLLFLDIGLLNYISGIDWMTVSRSDEIMLVNEGPLAEQFIGQQLLYRNEPYRTPVLQYWLREKKRSNAEVDYVISVGNAVIPIEVKSGKTGSLKSLFQFFDEKEGLFGIRFYFGPYTKQTAVHKIVTPGGEKTISFPLISLPLYLVNETKQIIASALYS